MNILLLIASFFSLSSFYDYSIPASNGTSINLTDYRGKKVMLVNIASSSTRLSQLARLEELHQKYKDSLVIIAVPSNSFDDEPLTDAAIQERFNQDNLHFLLAAKSPVTGTNALGVYKWFGNMNANGRASVEMTTNFQKILVDGNGQLIGLFSVDEDPMSETIQKAIRNEE